MKLSPFWAEDQHGKRWHVAPLDDAELPMVFLSTAGYAVQRRVAAMYPEERKILIKLPVANARDGQSEEEELILTAIARNS